jgi:hypothetical protein
MMGGRGLFGARSATGHYILLSKRWVSVEVSKKDVDRGVWGERRHF